MAFPLYLETYRIGPRNYRRNPYKHGASYKKYCDVGDTPDLYPEENDEAEDGPSCTFVDEEISHEIMTELPVDESQTAAVEEKVVASVEMVCADDPRVTVKDNWWTSSIEVPMFLYGKLIGMQGKTLRQLEDSTSCRVKIPRRGQKGPVVIKSSLGLENVQRCLDQIEVIIVKGKANARFTHFAAFPCNHTEVMENFIKFRDEILSSETLPESIKDETLFVNPQRLHLTLTMLCIFDMSDEVKSKLALEAAGLEIKKKLSGGKIIANICGLSIMNDDPCNVDVLYANATGTNLQEASNIVYHQMVAAGLTPEIETGVSTTASPVKLHVTLINSRKQAQKTGKKRTAFDAADVMERYKNFIFGTITMDRISICKLNSNDTKSYYEEIGEIRLN